MKKFLLFMSGCAVAIASQAVTFRVSVPSATEACYVSGAFNNWSAETALKMESDSRGHFILDAPDLSDADVAQGFKYLCGPAWKYVEKGASGEELGNRTVAGREDVVASWAALFDASVISHTVNICGYDRNLRIVLPDGYENSSETYPVVYMIGVQQRYSDAGSDNAGDDFFGADSWNAAKRMAAKNSPCVMVGMYTFVAESIPFATEEFVGSGATAQFLQEYIAKVADFVENTYRVRKGAENATVVGADLGGLTALYAAALYPSRFGNCVAMSPLLRINPELKDMMADLPSASNVVLTYGSLEPKRISEEITSLAEAAGGHAKVIEFSGAFHDDVSWGASLQEVLPAVIGGSAMPDSPVATKSIRAIQRQVSSNASESYSFYYTESGETPEPDASVLFRHTDGYVGKSGNTTGAYVLVKDISKSFKSKCYWNVMDNATGEFLSDVKNVSFSSKKTAESWLRVVVKDDGTLESTAASSIGFRIVAADDTKVMEVAPNHTVTSIMTFGTSDKSFEIHYGSVNSQSDMGAVTGVYNVSDDCLEAYVTYDFMLNGVTVVETKHGEELGDVRIVEFSALPAVTVAGGGSLLSLSLDNASGCVPSLNVSYNYGAPTPLGIQSEGDSRWIASLSDLKEGLYRITLNLSNSSTTKENYAEIAVRVKNGKVFDATPELSVNAYDGVDWSATGQYKANFHTHTSQSFDDKMPTHEVVDLYHQAGYKVLALTDHDFNAYPWNDFDLFCASSESRDPASLGMLAIPGVELSKDNTNSWSETAATGDFNHHNDFFTGRKGQEFATLRESYAYTQKLGGMQIINHPGQYWSLDKKYVPGEKNSPEWHAENFRLYDSLIGLEVYNQGNRRPNDRILWDQILDMTMPGRPVWGYSCDDTHNREQFFRNYQYMLMPDLTLASLKEAMKGGVEYFCYEYSGSGLGKTPRISNITVDTENSCIEIDTDAENVYWITSTDIRPDNNPSSRRSTIVGMGKRFNYSGFQAKYVRALLTNEFGETCTQPFGFTEAVGTGNVEIAARSTSVYVTPDPTYSMVKVQADDTILNVRIFGVDGCLARSSAPLATTAEIDVATLAPGVYVVIVDCGNFSESVKIIKK